MTNAFMIRQVAQSVKWVDNSLAISWPLTREMPVPPSRKASESQARLRADIREWLMALLSQFPSKRALAAASEVSPASIYRALDEDGDYVMSTPNLNKIARAAGVAPPSGIALDVGGPSRGGLGEGELRAYDPRRAAGPLPPTLQPGDDQSVWIVASRALELYGYLPGDVVLVDFRVAPVAGDVVCAQISNLERGGAETVIRVFEPPFLTTKSLDTRPQWRPYLVDHDRVVVRGTVIRSVRERDGHRTSEAAN